MGIKVTVDYNKIRSRLREDLRSKKRSINYDRIGRYIVNRIQTDGEQMIRDYTENDNTRLERVSMLELSTSKELLSKVDYRILRTASGNPKMEFGIFGDEDAARALAAIEYGTTKTPEIPIFRTIIPECKKSVTKYIKNKEPLL